MHYNQKQIFKKKGGGDVKPTAITKNFDPSGILSRGHFYTLNIAVVFVGLVIVVVVVSLYFSFFLFNVTS